MKNMKKINSQGEIEEQKAIYCITIRNPRWYKTSLVKV